MSCGSISFSWSANMNHHIDWEAVETHWDDYKDRIKHQWNKLTDDDLRDIHGDRYRLMRALQDYYEISRDKVEKQLNDFLDNSRSWLEGVKQRAIDVAEHGKHYVLENSIADVTADIRRTIRKNPIRTVLLSVGIGYMVGRIY